MFKTLTKKELEQKKFEILDLLLYLGSRKPSGTYHVRDIVNDPVIWFSWRKENLGVFLWLGRMYYKERKTDFKGIDHGAAIYLNQ